MKTGCERGFEALAQDDLSTADAPPTPVWREAAALDQAGSHQEAIALLSRAAAAGDAVARRVVGLRILLGDRAPLLGAQGVGLIRDAATQGDALAADLAAIVTGAGIHCAQDWAQALDWLCHAAELGSPRARGALGVLCADAELGARAMAAPDAALWSRLRADVDMAAWLSPPPGRTLHEAPLVRAHADFADARLCAWLVAQAHGRLARAEVYNPHTQGVEQTPERTNSAALFGLLATDLAQIVLQARIAAAVGAPFSHLEPAAVLHYAPGQVFEDHYDFVDPAIPDYAGEIARNGQRRITVLLYLNDAYGGGETEFPRLGLSHRGQAGEAFLFVNAHADGAPDTRALHAGRPPVWGEKWVLAQFVRDRPVVPGSRPD